MKYPWLDDFLLAKRGAVKEFKAEWNATRYLLRDKIFCMEGFDNHQKPILTLKGDPPHNEDLRNLYPDIIPGYYMNKAHWNSVLLEGDVPDDIIREMIDRSYELVFASLSKKAQQEIHQEATGY